MRIHQNSAHGTTTAAMDGAVLTLIFSSLPPPQSSCIPFSYWKETVSVLLGSDRTSLCAIASYIDEPFMDLDRDLLED